MADEQRELELVIKGREATQEAFKAASAEVKALKDDVSHAAHAIESLEDQYVKIFSGQARKGMHGLGTGILEEADAIVAAVGRIGGAAKLTEAEQEKINRVVAEAAEKYRALGQQAPEALGQLAQATARANPPVEQGASWWKQFGDQVKASAIGFVSAEAALGAIQAVGRGVVQFLQDSVTSAAAAEAAHRKLTQALATQGLQAPRNVEALSDLAGQFQTTTVYADDLIMEMEGLLVQVGGVMPSEMRRALTAATDLASGLGIDLREATMLVAKAFAGGGDELGRLKAILGDTVSAGSGMAGILDAINAKFGGQAQAEIETYAGQIKQLANSYDDLKEAVGRAIIEDPVIKAIMRHVGEAARETAASADAGISVTQQLALAAAGAFPTLSNVLLEVNRRADEANKGAEAFTQSMQALEGRVVLLPGAIAPLTKAQQDLARTLLATGQSAAHVASTLGVTKETMGAFAARIRAEHLEAAKAAGTAALSFDKLRAEADKLLAQGLQPLSQEQRDLIRQFAKAGVSVKDIAEKMGIYESSVNRVIKADQEATKAKERADDAAKKFRDTVKQTYGTYQAYVPLADAMNDRSVAMRNLWRGLAEDGTLLVGVLRDQYGPLKDTTQWMVGLSPAINGNSKELRAMAKAGDEANDSLKDLAQAFAQLSQVSGGAIGGVLQDLGTLVASANLASESVDAIGKGRKKGGAAGFLEMSSGLLGVAAAGLSAAKIIGHLFGIGKSAGRKELEEYNKQIKEFGQEWIAAAGGIDVAREKAALFGYDLSGILNNQGKQGLANVKTDLGDIDQKLDELRGQLPEIFDDVNRFGGQLPERFAPFVEQMQALGILQGDQGFNWQRLQGDAERYGISVAALGPKINGARLKEQAKDILDVWEEMEANNADMSGVLAGMSDEISALVQESLKFGTEIPANMKPMIEQLLASGQLLDENGHKMTDISGIQFGEPIKVGLDAVVDRLDKLLEGLGIKLPEAIAGGVDQAVADTDRLGAAVRDAIRQLPDHIEIPLDFPTRGRPVVPASPDVPEGDTGLVGNWGARGSLVRLHGLEAAIPLDRPSTLPSAVLQQVVSQNPQAFSSAAVQGGDIHVHLEVGGRELAETVVPFIPGVVRGYVR